jgi:hypothetical protein
MESSARLKKPFLTKPKGKLLAIPEEPSPRAHVSPRRSPRRSPRSPRGTKGLKSPTSELAAKFAKYQPFEEHSVSEIYASVAAPTPTNEQDKIEASPIPTGRSLSEKIETSPISMTKVEISPVMGVAEKLETKVILPQKAEAAPSDILPDSVSRQQSNSLNRQNGRRGSFSKAPLQSYDCEFTISYPPLQMVCPKLIERLEDFPEETLRTPRDFPDEGVPMN